MDQLLPQGVILSGREKFVSCYHWCSTYLERIISLVWTLLLCVLHNINLFATHSWLSPQKTFLAFHKFRFPYLYRSLWNNYCILCWISLKNIVNLSVYEKGMVQSWLLFCVFLLPSHSHEIWMALWQFRSCEFWPHEVFDMSQKVMQLVSLVYGVKYRLYPLAEINWFIQSEMDVFLFP